MAGKGIKMGCDIHLFAERRNADGSHTAVDVPNQLDNRVYARFAFLAGVRNYAGITPLAEPRGLPGDASMTVKDQYESWGIDAHTASWLSIDELLAFDYDDGVENRRYTREIRPGWLDGGCTAPVGEGQMTTWRELIGSDFIDGIRELSEAAATRIVFWFDN